VPNLGFSVAPLPLSFAGALQWEPGLLVPSAGALLTLYGSRRDRLRPAQRPRGVAWRWEPTYHRRRWQAGVLLDLLGHVPTPEVESELNRAVAGYTDPRLKMYALLSLLRHNCDVDPDEVALVAANPEARRWLFGNLQTLARSPL